MFESDTTAAGQARDVASVALSEVVRRIERRLAWYGLPRSGLCSIETSGSDSVVATVTVAGNGTFREVFDRRTGWVRCRVQLAHAA